MGYLPPLAATTDLSARLGRPLTAAEETRAYPLLQDASAQIRRYCRNDFAADTDITEILYGHDSEIELPRRPVNSVSGVVARSSLSQVANSYAEEMVAPASRAPLSVAGDFAPLLSSALSTRCRSKSDPIPVTALR